MIKIAIERMSEEKQSEERKLKVLYISQEITPFLPENEISFIGRHLPQGVYDKGKEIRVFMPRFGKVNERRHQLHEVIRLSGMNMIINDSDHPLIIKVASIPTARMQVYFIDNDEYFSRKAVYTDTEGNFFEDNDERMIFYVRGVLETVKKLGWVPDIIHCHGWMTSVAPMYIRTSYKDDPHFSETKILFSVYDHEFTGSLDKGLIDKIKYDGVEQEQMEVIADPTFVNLNKLAIQYSDAVILGSEEINPEILSYIEEQEIDTLNLGGQDNFIMALDTFYDEITEGKTVVVEE